MHCKGVFVYSILKDPQLWWVEIEIMVENDSDNKNIWAMTYL